MKLGPIKILILVLIGLLGLGALLTLGSLIETNMAGYYKVKQSFPAGNMTVRSTPGTFAQLFGTITPYKISDTIYLSKHDEDGGKSKITSAATVQFNDGGKADVSVVAKFRLSMKKADQLAIHEEFGNYDAVKFNMIRQHILESLTMAATVMKAEDAYRARRSEFGQLALAMAKEGIYATQAEEKKTLDADGNELITTFVKVKNDIDGNPIIIKVSPLNRYNIELIQFTVKDIDFDDTIDRLIDNKKKIEQERVVSKAEAEKARQNAIKEVEQGKARVAKAEADALVEKKTAEIAAQQKKQVAVLQAQEKFEVAELAKKEKKEEAQGIKALADAKFYENAKLVKAGLTPQQRAELELKKAVGVAEQLAKINLPEIMVSGGGNGQGGTVNPFDAIGLEALIKINEKLSGTK